MYESCVYIYIDTYTYLYNDTHLFLQVLACEPALSVAKPSARQDSGRPSRVPVYANWPDETEDGRAAYQGNDCVFMYVCECVLC